MLNEGRGHVIVQCTSCRSKFNAPDTFAGRKVRCRKCAKVIQVPKLAKAGAGGSDVLYADELETIDEMDFTGKNNGRGRGNVDGPSHLDLVDPDVLFEQASAEFEPRRSNALYHFPLSGHIDRGLPFAIVLPSLTWLCVQAFGTASKAGMPAWVGPLRLFVLLLGFLTLVLPATYIAVSMASRKFHFRLPTWTPWRVGAAFWLPYVIAAAMWLVDGQQSDLFLGAAVGLLMGLPALWLLLRLDPEEGPATLGFAGGAFIAGSGVVCGLAMLFATLINASADPANKPTTFAQNPLGPGLRWDRPPQKTEVVSTRRPPVAVQPPTPLSTTVGPGAQGNLATVPAAPTNPVPQIVMVPPSAPAMVPVPPAPSSAASHPTDPIPPATVDPLTLATGTPTGIALSTKQAIVGQFETILSVPAPLTHIATLGKTPEGQPIVTRYELASWKQAGEVTFSGRAPDYHVSPDGALVARLTSFPSLSVQVYSFADRKFLNAAPLEPTSGEPTILGFAGADSVLIHWRRPDGSSSLEVINAITGGWLKRIPKTGLLDPRSQNFAISGDGRAIALLTRPTDGSPAVVEVHSLGREKAGQTIPVTQLTWQPTVRVCGIALSVERNAVAIMVENEGQGLLLGWDAATGKLLHQHLYPSGLAPAGFNVGVFEGGAIQFVDNDRAWLVYGSGIYEAAEGKLLGTLDIPSPRRQWVTGDTCYILNNDEKGRSVLNVVKLNPEKIRGGTAAPEK